MKTEITDYKLEVAKKYFSLINELRNGREGSIDGLMELWHPDGTFDFCGSSPVVGSFKGSMAINALYKNRLCANGMSVKLGSGKELRETAMGIVETDVTHMREKENKVIAGWRTTIGTKEGTGFDVAGSHMFTIEDGKITSLRVNVSHKADQSKLSDLTLDNLSVQDVGRLSLAAWPVV